jgi:hypothetical protein
MGLSIDQINKARNEARQYLEYSSYTLCVMLGVDPENIDEEIALSTPDLGSYHGQAVPQLQSAIDCLKKQISILESIQQ